MRTRYEAIIVGAGAAGLAAAGELLRQSDMRLLLVDDETSVRTQKPLTFVDVITDFDLRDCILRTYRGFSMRSPLGSQAMHDFQEPPLAVIDYSTLCQLMAERIRNYDTLDRSYSRITKLRSQGEEWIVNLSNGETVQCALVIDASGRAQVSAKLLGYASSTYYSHCYGETLADCNVSDEEVCYFLGGGRRFGTGGGWFYPLGEGMVSFGYAQVTRSSRYPAAKVRAGYEGARTCFEPYAGLVAGSRRMAIETGSIPVGPTLPLVGNGLMRVGDAAGQASPWMCMGVEPALLNGTLCGKVAAEAYQGNSFRKNDLKAYERIWRRRNWLPYRQAMLLAPLQWVEDEERWDRAIAAQNRFTSDEMLSKLRENYPVWPLPTLYWFRLYDLLGRMRRGVASWLSDNLTPV